MKDLPIATKRKHHSWLLFGASGAGKTTLAATAPRPIIVDSNQGTSSIEYAEGLEHVKRTPQITQMSQLDEVFDQLTGTGGDEDWRKRYDTPVFDSWDDMQKLIHDRMVDKQLESGAEPDAEELDQIQLRQYGQMYNQMSRYMRKMKKIPKHKIFICAEKRYEDKDMMWPDLIGQMKDKLPYLVDHTLYLRMSDKGVRYIHLNPKPGEWYAKTRLRWLPSEYRKIRFDLDDNTLLTDFFKLVAAGPDGLKDWKRRWK